MKILGLHGFGSSANIMKTQMVPFIARSNPSDEFVFIDGPFKAQSGPGLSKSFPDGPFFSHTYGYTPSQWTLAFSHLSKTVESLGPFDGAIGFSQIAALLLSYAFHEQCTKSSYSTFAFLMCFSSSAPFSPDPNCHTDLLAGITPTTIQNGSLTRAQETFVCSTNDSFQTAQKFGALPPELEIDFFVPDNLQPSWEEFPRILHPSLVSPRLNIPTVHVTGKIDLPAMHDMFNLGKEICDAKMRTTLQHSCGHTLSRQAGEIQEAVAAMEWAVKRSALRSRL
jgi:predicted esterase